MPLIPFIRLAYPYNTELTECFSQKARHCSIVSGSILSSLSQKNTFSPCAKANPALRAADTPACSKETILTPPHSVKFCYNFYGIVGRPIINDNYFNVLISLVKDIL